MAVITSSITASLMSMVFQPEKMLYGTKVHKKLSKLSYLNSNFALAPGCLNPALHNPARDLKVEMVRKTNRKIIMIEFISFIKAKEELNTYSICTIL